MAPNAFTAQHATQPDALPTGYACLIGTVLTPQDRHAYIQDASGRLRQVQEGDLIDGAIVTSIEDGSLLMQRGPEVRQMRVAGRS